MHECHDLNQKADPVLPCAIAQNHIMLFSLSWAPDVCACRHYIPCKRLIKHLQSTTL